MRVTGGKSGGGDGAGGIHNQGHLTVDNCAITDNSALSFAGGGILHAFNGTGPLKISNSTVANNDAPSGGGLFVHNATHAVTISNCVISGNTCTSSGGGIYSFGNQVFLLGSPISGNSASDRGGGIYNASATMTCDSVSSVTGNSAVNGGGGIYNDEGIVNLNAADVSGNTGGNCAGAPAVAGCVG